MAASYSDSEIQEAIAAISEPDRLSQAQDMVASVAPQLQEILNQALIDGGWFSDAHETEVLNLVGTADVDERLTRVRTLLAEEVRLGMFVGVAIGFELARELMKRQKQGDENEN